MRHIVGLKKALENGHGKPYENIEAASGWFLIDVLGAMTNGTGMQKIEAFSLANRLRDQEEFDMEEAEVKLCQTALDEAKLPAHIHAQLLKVLEGVKIEQPKQEPAQPAQPVAEPAVEPQKE